MAWTTPDDWSTGQVVSASDMNTQVRDNLKYLKGRALAQFDATGLRPAVSAIGGSGNPPLGPELDTDLTNHVAYRLKFDDSRAERAYGLFAAPADLVGGASVIWRIYWKTSQTSGDCRWGVAMQTVAHDEAWEDATVGTATHTQGTATATAGDLIRTDITLNSPGIAANDLVIVGLEREGDHTDDTLTGDAELVFLQGEVG